MKNSNSNNRNFNYSSNLNLPVLNKPYRSILNQIQDSGRQKQKKSKIANSHSAERFVKTH